MADQYLILLHNDQADHRSPGIWLTEAEHVNDLIRKCSLKFATVDIYALCEQESYVKPEYVQWGGLKLKHVARVDPSHQWSYHMQGLRNSLMDFSHEQSQQVVTAGIEALVGYLQERLTRPNAEEFQPNEELIDLTQKGET